MRRITLTALVPLLLALAGVACGRASASQSNDNPTEMKSDTTAPADTSSVTVRVETSMGSFTVLLYGDTPQHRDNFLKLVREGYYDGTLFHRVINQFMVQAGDPDSKTAAPGQRLGSGGPGYTIPAEIVFPKHFHKRYALAAARQGDQVNPEKRSSGSQFYIVTGQRMIPAQLQGMKQHLQQQQMQSIFNGLAAGHMDEIRAMQAKGDTTGLKALQDKLIAETEARAAANPLPFTPEMEKAYTETGGAPHLDGGYTVFGEVIAGQDVVDRIEKAETDPSDRPVEDIRIISMKVVQ